MILSRHSITPILNSAMKKHSLIIIVPAILIFCYLANVDQQAAFMFAGLLIAYSMLVYLATKTKNNVLITGIFLAAIANVIGTPLFILNKLMYSYSGWNAVKNFDFSLISFLHVYAYSFPSVSLLIGFVWLIEKCTIRYSSSDYKRTKSAIEKIISAPIMQKTNGNNVIWTFLFFILLIFAVVLAIVMYVNKIAVLGVEPERLPFRMVGILFYFRGYVLPIMLMILFTKTSQSTLVMILVIIMALIVGTLSASRGITFIYMFPVIVRILVHKSSFQRICLVGALVVFSYVVTSMGRGLIYSDQGLSTMDFLSALLTSESEFRFDEGVFVALLNVISTISNRLYGAQDLVLAYQYVLVDPWSSFWNFLFTGSIVSDLAGDLYGLVFLPGQGYGVGLGLVGLLTMVGRANILLLVIAILFFSFLAVLMNRFLTRLFFDERSGTFYQLYYLILFIAAFNFMQATLLYLYGIILLSYVLGYFRPRRIIKMRAKRGNAVGL